MADHFPPNINMEVPSAARMYDYLLGGKDNFEVDRKACDVLLERVPEILPLANDNRAYLARAAEYAAAQGLEQFLDLGAGLPTANNTHHAAQRANPRARVVYVDNDPIVLAHGRALITNSGETAFLLADLRDTEEIFSAPETRRLIDRDMPTALMLVALLHCLPDSDDPFGLVRPIIDSLPSGSCLIYSHMVSDDPATREWVTDRVLSYGTPWGRVRSPEEAAVIFEGLDLVSPWNDGRDEGPRLVDCATWRHPDRNPAVRPADPNVKLWEMAGVAFKP
ncbi:SAM-dependent methyltransferase [Nocardiopsis sp. FR26]|uniref:SAM-dependent methyltransferase n=1 Tax=Nocardiopsis sp. FR26 TaxID=2605987 RepID=UPI0013596A6F|nr:SAM-dependent methyltransferase [Nocardiopsis sp. FR26]